MSLPTRGIVPLLGALAVVAGCSGGRSALVLSVDSPSGAVAAQSLHLTLVNNGQTGQADYALPPGTPISTSAITLTARLPADRSGPVQITVDAKAGVSTVATGTAQGQITPGQETDVTVHLGAQVMMGDGGGDSAGDAAGFDGSPPRDSAAGLDLANPPDGGATLDGALPDQNTPDLLTPDLLTPDLAMPPRIFRLGATIPVGTNPRSLALGDLNNDGLLDAVVGATGGHEAWVSFHVGGLGATAQRSASVDPASPVLVALGDCNSDGRLDLLLGRSTGDFGCLGGDARGNFSPAPMYYTIGGTPSFLMANRECGGALGVLVASAVSNMVNGGKGDNNFGFPSKDPPLSLGMGDDPRGIATADFNGDGRPDFAIADGARGGLLILINPQNGPPVVPNPIPAGKNTLAVVTGDWNLDGKADLATANQGDNSITVLIGVGNGTFAAPIAYPLAGGPTAIVAADFDGDGTVDLAATAPMAGGVGFFRGHPNGQFEPAVVDVAGPDPEALAAGDVDGDGRMDLVVANAAANTIGVLRNITSHPGPLALGMITYTNSLRSTELAAIADFTGDGKPDLLVYDATMAKQFGVMIGDGKGSFAPIVQPTPFPGGPTQLATGDFDCDGRADVAVAQPSDMSVGIYLGNGDGSFRAGPRIGVPFGPTGLAAGDWDADGNIDLVATGKAGASLQQLFGQGHNNGNFSVRPVIATNPSPVRVWAGDLNSDGHSDLIGAIDSGAAVVWLADPATGNFKAGLQIDPNGAPSSALALGDLNLDGKLDVVVFGMNPNMNHVDVYQGLGNGTFNPVPQPQSPGMSYLTGTLGDLNGDGKLDLAVAGIDVKVLVGKGDLTFNMPITVSPNGNAVWPLVRDLDLDGKADLVVSGGGSVGVLRNVSQ